MDKYEYAILYDAKDGGWDASELHIIGKNVSLESYMERARSLVEEGHRNVRVVEYVTVAREVFWP